MGKKRRMIAKRPKFGKKFANHPCIKVSEEAPELVETPVVVVEVAEVTPIEVVEKTVAIEKVEVAEKKKKKTAKPTWSRKKKDD